MIPEKLEHSRHELEALNARLIGTIEERRDLVEKINVVKLLEQISDYDPKRESDLYERSAALLSTLSLKELLAFSLISESQAGASYPAWSLGVHCVNREELGLLSMINPLMLKHHSPEHFASIQWTSAFEFLRRMGQTTPV